MAQREQLDAFRQGLHPILIAGDVAAFQRYLSQWEDLLGDTAELKETSETQQRRTMDALLRRPQQFNLPPWPRQAPVVTPPPVVSAPPEIVERFPSAAAMRVPPLVPEPALSVADELEETSAAYQLDMLSGELVPVSTKMHPNRVTEPPGEAASIPARQRRSRRRPPSDLAQLVFWKDGEVTA